MPLWSTVFGPNLETSLPSPVRTGWYIHPRTALPDGTALTSTFLAREYDVQVWAVDLWTKPTENWQRIQEGGLAGQVHPIYADARSLPFAEGFFDAIVSLGAFHTLRHGCAPPAVLPEIPEARRIDRHRQPRTPARAWLRRAVQPRGPVGPRSVHFPQLRLVALLLGKDRFGHRRGRGHDPRRLEGLAALARRLRPVGRGFEPDAEMLRADACELLGFTRVRAHRVWREAGSDVDQDGCSAMMLTIHAMPNRSMHMPNTSPHICFSSGTVTLPPSDSFPQ